jgi:hypothetical protein
MVSAYSGSGVGLTVFTAATAIIIAAVFFFPVCCQCGRVRFNDQPGLIADIVLSSIWAILWFVCASALNNGKRPARLHPACSCLVPRGSASSHGDPAFSANLLAAGEIFCLFLYFKDDKGK